MAKKKKKKKKIKKLTADQKSRISKALTLHMTRFGKYKLRYADRPKRLRQFIEAVRYALRDQRPLTEAEADKWANKFADLVWPRGSAFADPRALFFICAESSFDGGPMPTTRAELLLGMIDTALYCCQNGGDEESNWDHDNESDR